jgi:phosphate butyryltransferase
VLKTFDEIISRLERADIKKIAVAMAEDTEVLEALEEARAVGAAAGILIGDEEKIYKICKSLGIDSGHYIIINAKDERECVDTAVAMVKEGEANVLMKGACGSAVFLKGVLHNEKGLKAAHVLSHLAIFESPHYHKLLFMSDAAMNISPDLNEKIAITQNAVDAAHALGYKKPKVAILSAVEKINPDGMPSTAHAAIIAKMSERNQIKDAIIDGPLAIDNAVSKRANEVKGLFSAVGGDADICIVPNIEAGNIFYKLLTLLGGVKAAGIVLGASAPIVLTSRADTHEAKFLSILTAIAVS